MGTRQVKAQTYKRPEFSDGERVSAAEAWDQGGCLALGLWLSKSRPHFSVSQYAAAVKAAREDLGDTTDYSAAAAGQGGGEGTR